MPTHGSMTKAGKVRKQTPKIPGKDKRNPNPRLRNRLKYRKVLEQPAQAVARRRR